MADVRVALGKNIRRILSRKGWKPAEVLRRGGFTRGQVYKWMLPPEHEYHTDPNPDQIVQLAKVLETSTDEILLGTSSPNLALTELESTLHRTLQRVKEAPPEWQTKIPREVINFLLTEDGQEIAEILLDPSVIQLLLTYARGKRNNEQYNGT